MSLSVDDPRPPYVQVADAVRADIAAGRLRPGQRLPAIRSLAERFGVAPMTVQNALRLLRDEGVTVTTPNRGSFVAEDADQPSTRTPGQNPALETLREEVERLAARVGAIERLLTGSGTAGVHDSTVAHGDGPPTVI